MPVTHGGSNRLVTVECVYFCETEGVALAIPLYYNVVIDLLEVPPMKAFLQVGIDSQREILHQNDGAFSNFRSVS